MPSSDLDALYKTRKITLWVEDAFTRTYLTTAWEGSPDVLAGGCSHMAPLVEDARSRFSGLLVYALRDRDFGPTNRPRWKPATPVFTTEVFESENWTLDRDAFAAAQNINTAKRQASDIEACLEEAASKMVWWLACRATLQEVRGLLVAEFPAHPKPGQITSGSDARQFIVTSPWWSWARSSAGSLNHPWVDAKLEQHEVFYRDSIGRGAHLRDFSGKELLQALLRIAWKDNWPPTLMEDTAREIAREQIARSSLPPEVLELQAVLRSALVPASRL